MAADVGVGDAENLQAVALQESGVLGVAEDGIRLGVLGAVQFNHEADAGTVKIYNVGTQHPLAVKADGIRPQKIIPKAVPLLPKGWERYFGSFLPQRRQKAKPSSAGAPQ